MKREFAVTKEKSATFGKEIAGKAEKKSTISKEKAGKSEEKSAPKKSKIKGSYGLLGGTLSLTISAVVVKLIGLVYKIPISALLGDEGMGYFNSAYTVFAFFYLLCTAGVPKAIMLMIADTDTKSGEFSSKSILSVALKFFGIIGGIFSLITLVFAGGISSLIGSQGSIFTLMAISPALVILAFSGVLRGYLSAKSRLFDIAISQLIEGVGKLALGLLLAGIGVRLGLRLQMLSALAVLGVSIGAILGLLYLFVIYKTENKNEKVGQSENKANFLRILKKILSISLPVTLGAAVMNITSVLDLATIMRSLVKIGYSESYAAALYGNYTTLAVPMFNLALTVVTPLTVAFLPPMRRAFLGSKRKDFSDLEKSLSELTSFLAAPMLVGMLFYSSEILSMLFKNSEIRSGAALLCLLAPAIFFASLLGVVNSALEAAGKIKAPLISMTVGSLVKIPTSLYFITKTSLGVGGAAIGSVVCYAVALITSLLLYGMELKKKSCIFVSSILPYLCAFVSVSLSRFAFDRLKLGINQSLAFLICVAIAALIYLAISMFSGIISREKMEKMAKYTKLS